MKKPSFTKNIPPQVQELSIEEIAHYFFLQETSDTIHKSIKERRCDFSNEGKNFNQHLCNSQVSYM